MKLDKLDLDDPRWTECVTGWTDKFTTPAKAEWQSMPTMVDLIPWSSPGVKPNRTWVYAPTPKILRERWNMIVSAQDEEKSDLFDEKRDANLTRVNPPLSGYHYFSYPFSMETGPCPAPIRIGYRSFDRQWIIPDSRLIATPRSALWAVAGKNQVFAIEQHAHPISNGPAIVFTNLLPDMDYHSGRGGRVLPLYRDTKAREPNVAPGLIGLLSDRLKQEVTAPDLLAYIAAALAHRGYTERFAVELLSPGVRVPLTAEREVWNRAVEIGREVVWLHTFGSCYVNAASGRPNGAPRMRLSRPKVQVAIPDTEDGMPDKIDYHENDFALIVGLGRISPVPAAVWNYQVSGMRVIKHWFDYRKRHPSGQRKSDLAKIVTRTWGPEMTTELLDLLNVIGRCVELEPKQREILEAILTGPLITTADLTDGNVLPVSVAATKAPKRVGEPDLWTTDP